MYKRQQEQQSNRFRCKRGLAHHVFAQDGIGHVCHFFEHLQVEGFQQVFEGAFLLFLVVEPLDDFLVFGGVLDFVGGSSATMGGFGERVGAFAAVATSPAVGTLAAANSATSGRTSGGHRFTWYRADDQIQHTKKENQRKPE